GNDVASRLEFGDQRTDSQQNLLTRTRFGRGDDSPLPVFAHLLGEERRQRLKLGNGGVEEQSGGDGHCGNSKAGPSCTNIQPQRSFARCTEVLRNHFVRRTTNQAVSSRGRRL